MGIELLERDINNIYFFRNLESQPVRLELNSNFKNQHISANGKKFKGTEIFMFNDLKHA